MADTHVIETVFSAVKFPFFNHFLFHIKKIRLTIGGVSCTSDRVPVVCSRVIIDEGTIIRIFEIAARQTEPDPSDLMVDYSSPVADGKFRFVCRYPVSRDRGTAMQSAKFLVFLFGKGRDGSSDAAVSSSLMMYPLMRASSSLLSDGMK